ncbi:hypothetical protein ACI3ER_25000 [Bacillus sp. Wb]
MKQKKVELFPGQKRGTIKVFINCAENKEPIQLQLELKFED